MEVISTLLLDLQELNEETKSTHSAKVLRGLKDRMDSNMVTVLRKVKIIKSLVDAQGEQMDDIELNVANARVYIGGGTNRLISLML
ncbi:hypothetical protein IFM89_034004 [Coptis chinensis]|uniref:t-SNARE coiled-coil homology domain-containing protein n=1 Tax=Coptis chinensis TaxID=261450 RepID=A0A835ISW2_9MAGN|nr:hypothetical protein IFM89_034004 [Coptis chinensis]